ncbi:MAG: PHB depolymerase family esterase [Pseudorhodobacter sp.]|nr:PHB depolymerase family esterase [Pseudorhodobacter sp.]
MTKFSKMIENATAMTRAGNLTGATAAIQAALHGPASGTAQDRAPLGETLRRIAAGGMPRSTPLQADVALPAGASFLSLTHSGPHGSRAYRLYVPANRTAQMPLIVMLHGCTQTPEDFAVGTGMNVLAEEFACLVAYPCQPSGANAQKCWNWFRPQDQVVGRGEPALIAGITADILRDYPADAARVYIAGLSAGGAAALIAGAAYPDLFAAIGVHSGLAVGAAQDVPSAFAAMRSGADGKPLSGIAPTMVFHGTADSTVNSENARAVMTQVTRPYGNSTLSVETKRTPDRKTARVTRHSSHQKTIAELWEIEGAGHAWSGGNAAGSYTDASGPDASRQLMRFFLQHGK